MMDSSVPALGQPAERRFGRTMCSTVRILQGSRVLERSTDVRPV